MPLTSASAIAMKAVKSRIENKLNGLHYRRRQKLFSLLDSYSQARDLVNQIDRDTAIANGIRRTTLKSFCMFGDRNCLTASMILHYIRKEGTPLDVQAMDITEQSGFEITPDDLYEFILEHPAGASGFYKFQEMETVEAMIKDITGFNTTPAMIRKIRIHFMPKSSHSNPF